MRLTFNKTEKLKSKKLIEQLFNEGNAVTVFPLKLIFIETTYNSNISIKTGVSVSKRNFKRAVDRNRIKRLLREAYRLNKQELFNTITTQYAFMILYIGKDGTTFEATNSQMKQLFKKFIIKTSLHETNMSKSLSPKEND
jgi:ribonuclease P protein component